MRVAARAGAGDRVRGDADGAVSRAARGGDVLRGVLPERPAAGVDVLLVLRGAAAAPRGSAGVAVRARARVLGGGVRAGRVQRRALLRGAALGHPVDPAHAARGFGGLRAHRGAGLSLRDPPHRTTAHHSSRHERVAEPPQELLGRPDHQRGRADLPDPPDRNLYREGHRGPHRGHRDLPRPLSLPFRSHGLCGAADRDSRVDRGREAAARMSLDLGVIWRNLDFLLVQGFLGFGAFVGGTVRLAIPSILLGFILGIFIGLARLSPRAWIRIPATVYVEFFRGVPLVMVIFWIWFILPILLRTKIPEFGVALTAFVIFEAAYLGEIVRAGIQSVARGQVEAATALGLRSGGTMRFVVLPQALKNMIPSLVTQFIVLFKDTSLASIIGFMDLTKAAQVVNNREIRPFELYLFIAVVYWVCTYSMSRYSRALEKRLGPA